MQVNDYIKLTGIALGASAGLFVSYKIYKGIQAKAAERKSINDFKQEIITSNLSFSDADYKTMADRIYTALNQTWNDNEDTVYSVLGELKTKSDWLKLVQAFGRRERKTWYAKNINGNLILWLEDALEWWELEKVKKILNKIGVTF